MSNGVLGDLVVRLMLKNGDYAQSLKAAEQQATQTAQKIGEQFSRADSEGAKLAATLAKQEAMFGMNATAARRFEAGMVQATTAERAAIDTHLRNIEAMERQKSSMDGLEKMARRVGLAFGAMVAAGVVGYGVLADQATNLRNQVVQAVGSQEAAAAAQSKVYDMAMRTGTAYGALAGTYATLTRAAEPLGVSQGKVLRVVEAVNNAMALSPGSASAMQAGLVQLSQGLASGTLRGDELNSVLEQIPELADAIARGMGVTRGELRQLGADGKITAQAVMDALDKMGPELAEKVANAQMTIGKAMTNMGSAALKMVGDFDAATGITAKLAEGLNWVAQNLDKIATVLGAGAIAGGMVALVMHGGAVLAMLKGAALAASALFVALGPIALVAVGVMATAAALVYFREELTGTGVDAAGLGEILSELWGSSETGAKKAADANAEAAENTVGWWQRGLMFIAQSWDMFASIIPATAAGIGSAIGEIATGLKQVFANAFNWIIEKAESTVNYATRAMDGVSRFFGGSGVGQVSFGRIAVDKTPVDVGGAFARGFAGATLTDAQDWMGGAFARIRDRKVTAKARGMADAGESAWREADIALTNRQTAAEKDLADIRMKQAGVSKDYQETLAKLQNAREAGVISEGEYIERVKQLATETWEASKAGKEAAATKKAGAKAASDAAKEAERAAREAAREAEREATAYQNVVVGLQGKIEGYRLEAETSNKLTAADKERMAIEKLVAQGKLNVKNASSELVKTLLEELDLEERNAKWAVETRAENERYIQSIEQRREALAKEIEQQKEANAKIGLSAEALMRLEVAKLNDKAASVERRAEAMRDIDASGKLTEQLMAEAAEWRRLAGLKEEGYTRQSAYDATKQMGDELKRITEQYEQGLTNAAMQGGKSLKQYLFGLFRTTAFRILLQPVMAPLAGLLAGLTGSTGAAAGAVGGAGGIGNVLGMGSNLLGTSLAVGAGNIATLGMATNSIAASGVGLDAMLAANGAFGTAGGLSGALAAIPGWGWALAGLAVLAGSGIFKKSTPHIGGAADNLGGIDAKSIGLGLDVDASAVSAVHKSASTIAATLSALDKAFGGAGNIRVATGYSDDSSKDGGQGAFRVERGGQKLLDWRDTQNNKWAPKIFSDGEAGQKEYAVEVAKSTIDAFRAIVPPGWAREMVDDVAKSLGDSPTLEQASQALNVLTASIGKTKDAIVSLTTYMTGFAGMSGDAVAGLIKLAGGLDAFSQRMASYTENFYSEQERADLLKRQLTDQLGAVGLDLPATREAFRAEVEAQLAIIKASEREKRREVTDTAAAVHAAQAVLGDLRSLDLTSTSGAVSKLFEAAAADAATVDEAQARYNALMAVNAAFAELVPAAEDAAASVTDLVQRQQDLLTEQAKLRIELLAAQGDMAAAAAARRALETQGYNDAELTIYDANTALTEQIALEKQRIELFNQQKSIRADLMAATGDVAGAQALRRELATAGFSDAALAIYDANQALTQQIGLEQQRLELLRQQQSIQADLMEASGDIAGARALRRELETIGFSDAALAIYDANAALREQIASVQQFNQRIGGVSNSLSSLIQDGLLGNLSAADLGGRMADVVIGGVYGAMAQGFSQQITSILMNGLVTPMVQAAVIGASVTEAVSRATIDKMVAEAAAVAQALGAVLSDPAFRAAMAQVQGIMESLGASIAPAQAYYVNYDTRQQMAAQAAQEAQRLADQQAQAAQRAADEAAQRERAILSERQGLLKQLLQLEGNTTLLRQMELEALDPSNRALQERIWALQDETAAAEKFKSAMRDAQDFLGGFTKNIEEFIFKVSHAQADAAQSYQMAAAKFSAQMVLARGGDRDAMGGITSYADTLIGSIRRESTTGAEANLRIARVLGQLASLPKQISPEQLIVDAIASANTSLEAVLNTSFASLDANVDGLLTAGELAASGLATNTQIQALIARVDTNGDGMISKQEVANGRLDAIKTAQGTANSSLGSINTAQSTANQYLNTMKLNDSTYASNMVGAVGAGAESTVQAIKDTNKKTGELFRDVYAMPVVATFDSGSPLFSIFKGIFETNHWLYKIHELESHQSQVWKWLMEENGWINMKTLPGSPLEVRSENRTPAAGWSVFAEGGYTGPGAKWEPAGVVHRGEVVWSQSDVARWGGPGIVDALRQGRPGYADGGAVAINVPPLRLATAERGDPETQRLLRELIAKVAETESNNKVRHTGTLRQLSIQTEVMERQEQIGLPPTRKTNAVVL